MNINSKFIHKMFRNLTTKKDKDNIKSSKDHTLWPSCVSIKLNKCHMSQEETKDKSHRMDSEDTQQAFGQDQHLSIEKSQQFSVVGQNSPQ